MSERQQDPLCLDNQVCFALYACSRDVIKRCTPFLEPLDLTYTQYIAMLVLWERRSLTVKELGERLYLDSGTLTPLMKKMEAKGLLTRARSTRDERNLVVTLTPKGEALRAQAAQVPGQMNACVPLSPEELAQLYKLCYKILGKDKCFRENG